MRMKRRNQTLPPKTLMRKIDKSLARLSKLNFLENYAMFMSKAQLVEFALKKILFRRFRYSEKKRQKMTLGGAIANLDELGLRKDFVSLLRDLNKARIEMAHEFLANYTHLNRLVPGAGQLSWRSLRDALFKIEQTIHVYDWLNQNKCLFVRQRIVY